MLTAIVDSVIRLPKAEVAGSALERIRRELTFPNPEYVNRKRFNRSVANVPREICLVAETRGEVRVPRGAVDILRQYLGDLSFYDRRSLAPCDFPSPRYTLRGYQDWAVRELAANVQGCAVLPTGSGKTVIGTALIRELGQRGLVIVHTKDLGDQWVQRLAQWLGGEEGWCVTTVQRLAKFEPAQLETYGRAFGTVIVDEAHRAGCPSFVHVLNHLPAKFRFGLTATPERSDGLTPLLELCIGPIAYEVDHETLIEAGHLVAPRVERVNTAFAPTSEEYTDLVRELVESAVRNERIVRLATLDAAKGHRVLVLTGRVEHAEQLAREITAAGAPAKAITGRTPRLDRVAHLDAFRDGQLSVLCATQLADEGLDVPALDRVILAIPSRAKGRTIQRLGRLMRPHPGKGTPVLYDLVDDHPLTISQWAARQRAYRTVLGVAP